MDYLCPDPDSCKAVKDVASLCNKIDQLQDENKQLKDENKKLEEDLIRACENWKAIYCIARKKLDAVTEALKDSND